MTKPNEFRRNGHRRGPALSRRLPSIVRWALCSSLLLCGNARAAFVEITPGGGFEPIPTPTASPRPPRPADPCELPKGPELCFGAPRIDEAATILANPVLQRTCGRFIAHRKGGNAVLRSAVRGPALGKRKGPQAWVMALRGCHLDKIRAIEVEGSGVTATILPASSVADWLSSEPTLPVGSVLQPVAAGSFVLVRFQVEANAHTAHERALSVVFANGPGTSTQALGRVRLQVAHNGVESRRRPLEVRWEEETPLVFGGARLADARFVGPACVKQAAVTANDETSLAVTATFHCPVPIPGEPGVTVNDPTCDCAIVAYDKALDAYPELPKRTFNYFSAPLRVVANLDYLKEKPAVVGDSLSHGAFSGTVTERSQRWAYPHQVVLKMGGTPLVQNIVHTGPNVEDAIKTILFDRYGPAPGPFLLDPEALGLLEDDSVTAGESTDLPTHTGVAGFDYTNVLRTSGICLDKELAVERREDAHVPKQICSQRCEDADGNEYPSPSVDAQLALGCSDKSPIEMMEEIEPTFVFAAAAPNHALSCAVTTRIEECLEWDRFERDSAEVFRRLRAIGSIKGGAVFGIPPLASIPYLQEHRPEAEPCAGDKTQLRAFWKEDLFLAEDEIIDCEEREQLDDFIVAVNDRLRDLAALNRYAYVDSIEAFTRLENEGQVIRDEQGDEICRAKTEWPTRTRDEGPDGLDFPENFGNDAGCGMFGLDGAHPSQFGHTVMANELIGAIDEFYGVDIPKFDDGELLATWEDDDLAQDPIDMDDFMRLDPGEIVGEGVGVAACIAPALLCAATNGIACLGVAQIDAILALTPVRDLCLEPVVRALVTELGFKPIDAAIEPAHCWDDHCPVAADATPSPAD
jgi:hypothetical protein